MLIAVLEFHYWNSFQLVDYSSHLNIFNCLKIRFYKVIFKFREEKKKSQVRASKEAEESQKIFLLDKKIFIEISA